MKFGLTLPHFGESASRETLLDFARLADEYGFDSLWARDHCVYRSHDLDPSGWTFIETFVTLSSVSAVVGDIDLGTAVANQYRHPLVLAQLFSTLDYVSEGQVIAGLGAGGNPRELQPAWFEGVGDPYDVRAELHEENVRILRALWRGEDSYDGEFFSIEDAEQHPLPDEPIPIWGGGNSPAAVRRVKQYCDGWIPGKVNFKTFDIVIRSLREHADETGRDMPTVATTVLTTVDEDTETALGKIKYDLFLEKANATDTSLKWNKRPDSGEFRTLEDVEGMLIAGAPAEVLEQVEKFEEHGIDHIVFDLRQRFDEYEYCLELLGDEVIGEF